MKECQVNEVLEQTFNKLQSSLDVNTIIGTPIETTNNETVIPITKVSVGFVVGGGEYNENNRKKKTESEMPFAGGSGGGFNITPVGFLVIKDGVSRVLKIDNSSIFDKAFDLAVDIYNKNKK